MEIDKRTSGNLKGKGRTEREYDAGSAMGRERGDGATLTAQQIVLKGAFGHVEVRDLTTWKKWDHLNENEKFIECKGLLTFLHMFNICVEFRSSSRACTFTLVNEIMMGVS